MEEEEEKLSSGSEESAVMESELQKASNSLEDKSIGNHSTNSRKKQKKEHPNIPRLQVG